MIISLLDEWPLYNDLVKQISTSAVNIEDEYRRFKEEDRMEDQKNKDKFT